MLGFSLLQRWLVFRMVSMRYAKDQVMNEDFGSSAFPKAFCAFYGSSFLSLVLVLSMDGSSSGRSLSAT